MLTGTDMEDDFSSKRRGSALREIERLISLESDECQLWPFARSIDGYGKIKYKGRTRSAHRLVFFLVNGHDPSVVRHTCDVPLCCNPRHLIGGTHADNAMDRLSRSRQYKGSRNSSVLLTEEQILEIKREFDNCIGDFPTSKVAEKYGISARRVRNIIYRRTWQQVGD